MKPVATRTTPVRIGSTFYDLTATGNRDDNVVTIARSGGLYGDMVATTWEAVAHNHALSRADLAALVAQAADALPVPPSLATLHAEAEATLVAAHAACSDLEEALVASLAADGTGPTQKAAALAAHIDATLDGLAATRRKLAVAIRAVTP